MKFNTLKAIRPIFLIITLYSSSFAFSNDRIDSLLLVYETLTDEEKEFDLLVNLANAYVNVNTDSTAYYLGNAHKLIGKVSNKSSLADYHYSKAKYLHTTFRNDSAIAFFKIAKEEYRELQQEADLISANLLIANCFVDILEYDSAIYYYNNVLILTDSIKEPWNFAAYLNNIANVYNNQNKKVDALEYYIRAHDIFVKENAHREMGITKNNIGQLYHENGDLNLAINYIMDAISINEEINNVEQLLLDYNSMSLVYKDMEVYDSAIYYISKAVSVSKESNFEYSLAQSYHNLGSIYFALEDYKNAEKYFLKSQEISERLDISVGIVINMIKLGKVNLRKKNYQDAEKIFTEALVLSKRHSLTDYESSVLYNFNVLYKEWGIYDKALSYYEEYTTMRDSLYELRNQNKLNEIQAKYESEQKELENQRLKSKNQEQEYTIFKQRALVLISVIITIIAALIVVMMYNIRRKRKERIAILQVKNQKIEEQAEELAKSNKTKDKLFSIISHDLRSPFSSLMGFVSILEQEVEDQNFENMSYYIKQLNTATLNTYELIDNLLNWSRTQQDNIVIQITPIKIQKSVEEIIDSMSAITEEKGLNVYNEVPEDLRIKSDTHILSVIIRNLISNAIKFTERGGNIYVSINIKENESIISVRDNGVGIADDIKDKLLEKEVGFSTPGTENEAGSGIGILLVKEFVEKLGGRLMIESKPGIGSSFSFSIPN